MRPFEGNYDTNVALGENEIDTHALQPMSVWKVC